MNCIIWVNPLRKNPIPKITLFRAETEQFAGGGKGRTKVIKEKKEPTESTVDKNNFICNLNLPSTEEYLVHAEEYLVHTAAQTYIRKMENISFFTAFGWKSVKGWYRA